MNDAGRMSRAPQRRDRPRSGPGGSEAAAASRPPRRPWTLALLGVVAACLVVSTSTVLDETDFWQHLLVGRVIWETHGIPGSQVWTWPTFGVPDVLPSWGFRAALWPFWKLGGVWGLFTWRWITTLTAFAIALATARRMGARAMASLVVVVVCGLAYRSRALPRPESLVAILLAVELWILERRRLGMGDRSPWLVGLAWVWANVHLSYALGLLVVTCYLADERISGRSGKADGQRSRLPWVLVAMGLVSLANPFGWRALWQPFDFALHGRNEILYRDILELRPVDWRANATTGLPLLVVGWPLLLLWRARRRGLDWAELLICSLLTAAGLAARRFTGFYVIAAIPFLLRDLDPWLSGRAAARVARRPGPSATRPRPGSGARARAVFAALACVAVCLPEWSRSDLPLGIGVRWDRLPVRACDFAIEHGIRGRVFNPFYFGGYMLHRFWPDRERLPFMDIHQAGTPELRLLYMRAFYRPVGWSDLDRRYRFQWALVDREQRGADRLLDFLDADPHFALVFLDDAAAVFVRRQGRLAPVAEHFSYHVLPASAAARAQVLQTSLADSALRRRVVEELGREVAGSPWNATASRAQADLAMFEGRMADARRALLRVLAVTPDAPSTHGRLGLLALAESRPREALREFERERATSGESPATLTGLGNALRRLGERDRARAVYRRALALDPGLQEARDSLAVLDGR